MAKLLVIGDPHLKVANQSLVIKFLNWVQDVVAELKPDYVCNLGDTFHTHNVVRTEIMNLVDAHLQWMDQSGATYYILVGNHDMAHHKTPEIHAWKPFMNKYDFVHIIANPEYFDEFSLIPYIDSQDEFQKALYTAMAHSKLIFCHQTFRGANFGFITTKEGALVPEWDGQIISGHIHKSQRLGCVWYPGTPFAQEAADHNELKGIYLYDTLSKTVEFILSPLPQWVTSRANPANFVDVIGKMVKENKNHLVVSGPCPEVNAVVDSKLFQDLKKEYGFSVKKESTSSDKSTKSLRKVATVEDAVVEYVDRIYDGAVDKELLKQKCLASLQ